MPHRNYIIKQIKNYIANNPDDKNCADKIINFVNQNSNCFSRENKEGHVTGSAWLVDPEKQHVLLTFHKKLNKWLQLGGHAENNHDIFQVALKEAQEESGISDITPVTQEILDIDIHEIPARSNISKHIHYDIRYCFVAAHKNYKISPESHDLAWVPIKNILENKILYSPNLIKIARKFLRLN